MDSQQAADELKVIRQLMERPVRYSTQSGLSGIWAGGSALLGLAADWYVCTHFDEQTALWINLLVWGAVFVVATGGVWILTRLRERPLGMPAWSSVKMRILRAALPPFAVGLGLTAAIICRWYFCVGPNEWGLIPALWMGFYGVALWQVGEFGPREVRLLGLAFMLAALPTATCLQTWPYLTLGITFGGFHIVYGAIVWLRHGG